MGSVSRRTVRLCVNGFNHAIEAEPRESLLDILRERLGLKGTKKGCDQGASGACTVLVDGHRILACLALAVQYENKSIITIEGIGGVDDLHPMQMRFLAHDGFQCGYCTPGQICSAIGMMEELKAGVPSAVTHDLLASEIHPSDDEIKERMSGNLCRCGAYLGILEAIREGFEDGEDK